MNGRRKEKFTGIYPGSYTVGAPTKSDIPVTAEGPDGPVIVGRFPIARAADAEAQAKAYAAMPGMIDALRAVVRDPYATPGTRHDAEDALKKAGA